MLSYRRGYQSRAHHAGSVRWRYRKAPAASTSSATSGVRRLRTMRASLPRRRRNGRAPRGCRRSHTRSPRGGPSPPRAAAAPHGGRAPAAGARGSPRVPRDRRRGARARRRLPRASPRRAVRTPPTPRSSPPRCPPSARPRAAARPLLGRGFVRALDGLVARDGLRGRALAATLVEGARLDRVVARERRALVGEDVLREIDRRRCGLVARLRLHGHPLVDALEREREAAPLGVDLEDPHVHRVALRDDLARVLDVVLGELADVDEPLDSRQDLDERPERDDLRHL